PRSSRSSERVSSFRFQVSSSKTKQGSARTRNSELGTRNLVADSAGAEESRLGERDALDRDGLSDRGLGECRVRGHHPPGLAVVGAEAELVHATLQRSDAPP